MNKEFIILSDGNVAVTNEIGHISKQKYTDNIQKILLLENKIETIDNKLKKLDNDLPHEERILYLSKGMLKFQPIILILISAVSFIYGGITSPSDFITYGLYNGIKSFVLCSFICGATAIYFGIFKKIYKKKVEKARTEISTLNKLKQNYEKELSVIKEKQSIAPTQTISVDAPVSLIEQTNKIETQIAEEINKNHIESESLSKKLILRRKNEHKKDL